MTATIVVAAAAPATDTVAVDRTAGTSSDGRAGWAVLAIAAIAGLVLGRRRFGRPAEAAISD